MEIILLVIDVFLLGTTMFPIWYSTVMVFRVVGFLCF